MDGADWDIDRFVLLHDLDQFVDRDACRAARHDRVFGAVVMLLQRQPVARLHDDPLDLVSISIVDRNASRSRLGGLSSLVLLIGLILILFPAAAEVYPASGVWATTDTDFPATANETCIAVKNLRSCSRIQEIYPQMIIFAGQKRFDAKGDAQTDATN